MTRLLRRYRAYLRRGALRDMRAPGSFLRGQLALPLFLFGLASLVLVYGGATLAGLVALAVLGAFCLAWYVFVLREWWRVYKRFSDRRYRMFTSKLLSKEYRHGS